MATTIKYFISKRSKDRPCWTEVYDVLTEKNIPLHTKPVECDISVILGGTLVNPIPLKGKKVLAFKEDEWRMVKWKQVYKLILEEYYDYFIDTTHLSPLDTYRMIEMECENL